MELAPRKIILLILTLIVVLILISTSSKLYGYVKTSLSKITLQENEIYYGASIYILQGNIIYKYENDEWWYKEKDEKLYQKAKELNGLGLDEGINKLKKKGDIEIYKDEELSIPISIEEANEIYTAKAEKIDINKVKEKLKEKKLYEFIKEIAKQNGIDPNLVIAIIAQESGPKIISGNLENIKGDFDEKTGKYNAIGIMQVWPTQAGADVCKYYSNKFNNNLCPCEDPDQLLKDAKTNIYCGILYLKVCKEIYHKKTLKELAECYNGGPKISNENTMRYSANIEYYYNKLKA